MNEKLFYTRIVNGEFTAGKTEYWNGKEWVPWPKKGIPADWEKATLEDILPEGDKEEKEGK